MSAPDRASSGMLGGEILAAIRHSPWARGEDDPRDWEALARRVFRDQVERIEAYGRWCRARGTRHADGLALHEIPAVPTLAYKHFDLFGGKQLEHRFLTSGTTLGTARGRSLFSAEGIELMNAAIDVNAARMLFPGDHRRCILALAPSPVDDPARIMSHGLARLMERFGTPESAFLVTSAGLDLPAALARLEAAAPLPVPVTLVGATFALPPLLDLVEGRHGRLALPKGSAVMDAGGMKGAGLAIEPTALRARIGAVLGVPEEACVNLLGMTELASQFYDDRIAAHQEGRPPRVGKIPPPWCRSWAVDPDSLEPVATGEVGILRHMDLANLERPAFLQTDDLGRCHADGSFEILGRAAESEARGCSLDASEWIAASGGSTGR